MSDSGLGKRVFRAAAIGFILMSLPKGFWKFLFLFFFACILFGALTHKTTSQERHGDSRPMVSADQIGLSFWNDDKGGFKFTVTNSSKLLLQNLLIRCTDRSGESNETRLSMILLPGQTKEEYGDVMVGFGPTCQVTEWENFTPSDADLVNYAH